MLSKCCEHCGAPFNGSDRCDYCGAFYFISDPINGLRQYIPTDRLSGGIGINSSHGKGGAGRAFTEEEWLNRYNPHA